MHRTRIGGSILQPENDPDATAINREDSVHAISTDGQSEDVMEAALAFLQGLGLH